MYVQPSHFYPPLPSPSTHKFRRSMIVYFLRQIYDIRQDCATNGPCDDDSAIGKYLNQPEVREGLWNAPDSVGLCQHGGLQCASESLNHHRISVLLLPVPAGGERGALNRAISSKTLSAWRGAAAMRSFSHSVTHAIWSHIICPSCIRLCATAIPVVCAALHCLSEGCSSSSHACPIPLIHAAFTLIMPTITTQIAHSACVHLSLPCHRCGQPLESVNAHQRGAAIRSYSGSMHPLAFKSPYKLPSLHAPQVRAALGVGDRTWEGCSYKVYLSFLLDVPRNIQPRVVKLLEANVRLLLYSGDKDFICNWMGET